MVAALAPHGGNAAKGAAVPGARGPQQGNLNLCDLVSLESNLRYSNHLNTEHLNTGFI